MRVLRANACAEASSGRVLFFCPFYLCNTVNPTGADSSHSPAVSGLQGLAGPEAPGSRPDNPVLPDSSVWQVPADSPLGLSERPDNSGPPEPVDSLPVLLDKSGPPARPERSEQPDKLELPDSSALPVPLPPEWPALPVLPEQSGKPWKTGIPLPLSLPRQARLEVPSVLARPEPAVSASFLLHVPTES